jgi:polyisoprenyl-teichoic acid--peptidoglycan teichoic acid transferase
MVQLRRMVKFQRNAFVVVALLLALSIVGCNMPLLTSPAQPTPISISNLLLTPASNAQPSPTPFQPYNGNFPGYTQATPTTTPQPENSRMNILVLGSDWRPSQGYRTDVILLVSINTARGTVSLVSFPRDLFVTIPGYDSNRINEAQEYGGIDLTKAVFVENFGVQIDHYVMTNFNGFKAIVNSLGGIYVNASKALSDHCDLPQAVDGNCYVAAGTTYMDGPTALWYVRSRYSTSDIDRLRRAQEVLLAIFQRLMSLDAIAKAPQLWSDFSSSIETDLRLDQILSLLPLAPTLLADQTRIHQYSLDYTKVSGYIVPQTGADVLLPDYSAIAALLNEAFSQ